MKTRPLLPLPDPKSTYRLTKSRAYLPHLKGFGFEEQVDRYGQQFDKLDAALQLNQGIELRHDPLGIAPD